MPNFRTHRIIGRVIRSLFVLFVLAVCALMIWRVFVSANIPDSIDKMMMNERIGAAYGEHGESLILLYQDQASITRAEKNYGYFSVPKCVFIPEADQVQIVVRYNNSTLKHLAEDYGLSEIPDKGQDWFDVTLVRTTDLTPENTEDNMDPTTLKTERYMPSDVIRDTTSLYTYYRYVFDDVRVEDLTVGVFADIYYVDDIHYEEPAYGTLCLYDNGSEWLTYNLTSADKKALAGES